MLKKILNIKLSISFGDDHDTAGPVHVAVMSLPSFPGRKEEKLEKCKDG